MGYRYKNVEEETAIELMKDVLRRVNKIEELERAHKENELFNLRMQVDNDGTALLVASLRGHEQVVKLLLNKGATRPI